MKQLFIYTSFLLFTIFAFAQSPENMGYQAVMRNADNSLIANAIIGVKSSILQGSLSGTVVYSETQSPTTDVNGLVSMIIGEGVIVSGVFAAIDWSNGPYFIKTETDPEGGTAYTIIGTSPLLSVPYALHAKTADSITGSSSSNNIQNQKTAAQAADFWITGDGKIDGKLYVNGLQTLYVPDQTKFDGSLIIGTGGLNLTKSAPNPLSEPGSSGVNNGKQNTFIGSGTGQENTSGNQNTFVGTWSGVNNTIGDQNTFIGMHSGWQNTTGYHSTYVGAWAGQANTTGYRNAFFGTDTGNYNITGSENSYFGNGAGAFGTTGFANSFFGLYSGINTNADNNSFFGRSSGFTNTSGYSNSFFGQDSGYFNTVGYDNVFFGAQSGLNNTTGYRNIAIGKGANFSLTTGNLNVSLGSYAGSIMTTGSSNTFIGTAAGSDTLQKVDAVNSTAIGNTAYTTKDNQVVLGNSAVEETILNGVVKMGDNTKNITTKGISFGMEEGNIEFIGSKFGFGFGSKIYQNGERALSIAGRKNSNTWIDNFTILDTGNVGVGFSTGTEITNNKLAVNGSLLANSIKKSGGTASEFLKADGSVDRSTYLTSAGTATNVSGIVAVVNGGTGSATQNFVDLSTAQTVAGDKTFTGTTTGITKTMVSLGDVDNTSDANKPISTAAQTALDVKVDKVIGERLINEPEIIKLSNQSGTNTGDDATNTQYSGLAASKEEVANKQNSLAVDGTAAKYPTVDAVNSGLATLDSNVVKLTGDQNVAGIKNFTDKITATELVVNGNGFFSGTVKLNNLSGTGTRIVVADAIGNLSTDSADYIKNQNGIAQTANMWLAGDIKAKHLILTQGTVAIGDNTKNITTNGISLGIDEGNIEFIGSKFGLGFGSKIYQNGERALSFAGRKNANTWTDNFTLLDSGNVGIGFSNGIEITNNKLAVNGNGFFNGTVKLKNLVGTGTRVVVADAAGNLTTDATNYIKNQNGVAQPATIWINGAIKAKEIKTDSGFGYGCGIDWSLGAINSNRFYIYNNLLGRDILKINSTTGTSIFTARTVVGTWRTTDNGVDRLQVDGTLLATSIKKSGGLADEILMADGSTQKINSFTRSGFAIKSTNYTLAKEDRTIEVINPSTITLPTATGIMGQEYRIINTSTGEVGVKTTSSQTIGNKSIGNETAIILASGETLFVVSNGSIWRKL
jgi:hypothetical protein